MPEEGIGRGVVDQNIHAAVFGEHLLTEPVAAVEVGQVTAVSVGAATVGLDIVHGVLQFLEGAGHQKDGGAGAGQAVAEPGADAGTGTGDQNHLAGDAAAQRATGGETLPPAPAGGGGDAFDMRPEVRPLPFDVVHWRHPTKMEDLLRLHSNKRLINDRRCPAARCGRLTSESP